MTYTALHNHSEYSLTDSILRIEDIVAFAKAQGAEAIALTDRNNLYGALKLYKKYSLQLQNSILILKTNGYIHKCRRI